VSSGNEKGTIDAAVRNGPPEPLVRIAILGTRGIPANYGGFETFAEQLGKRLAEQGHEVTVYGRSRSVPRGLHEYLGMRIVRLPAPHAKYFETVVHSIFSAIHALGKRHDLVYVCNLANVPAVIVLLLGRKRVVLNVDGLEWQRAKWNALGKAYYRACAWAAARLPAHVVTDARVIQSHYARAYGRHTSYFPYGTELGPVPDDGTLEHLGLEQGRYVLYVSRLEPENNAHVVLDAYERVRTELPLVILGDAPYANTYIAALHRTSDRRVRFPGAIYGPGYQVLLSHAALYVQATEVGGTHPALVEAMGFANAIVANDVPEHRETLADAGRYYSGADGLADAIQDLLDHPAAADVLRSAAQRRAAEFYSWDRISADYERWFRQLVGTGEPPRTP
jgi:glycosyltransferase involved in cell wall biosynthesis